MKIAVITPYYKETNEQLIRCHKSVREQTMVCDHIMVSDGYPSEVVDDMDVTHICLPHHGDYGDTPRLVGSVHVAATGYDALLYLDADNYIDPEHIANLVSAQKRTDATVITCGRTLRSPDGDLLGRCVEVDGDAFVDTNCYLLTRPAFPLTAAWGFKDRDLGIIGDRIFWDAVRKSSLSRIHVATSGMNYVSTFACHYLWTGRTPPDNAKSILIENGKRRMVNFYDVNPKYPRHPKPV